MICPSSPSNYIGQELICPNDLHILLAVYGRLWKHLRRTLAILLLRKAHPQPSAHSACSGSPSCGVLLSCNRSHGISRSSYHRK
ncbi:hypothetical protein BKA67DRAFT_557869 [Truncatella angustata]|uniref:Uncharacterized protein n=1 Tax=Truncatella angustata TaxID=152316 RepID=A0A9P9A1I4_9PEZI|nr:uncharacterized protein BKA67DRAFT_557869 [Truncatella angustata]KAH6658368.1 hypothetical protein BKA67DRAFT_557869 [Truncatella angustata]